MESLASITEEATEIIVNNLMETFQSVALLYCTKTE